MQRSIFVCQRIIFICTFSNLSFKYLISRPNMAQYFSLLYSVKQSECVAAKKKSKFESRFRKWGQLH